MRSTYPDYFEKQKTTDTLPCSSREAHFTNYTNKLKLQIGATHTSRYMSVYFRSLLCIELIGKSEWLKTTVLQNNWSQRTYLAWTHAVSQTVNILLHWMSVALASVQASLFPYFTHKNQQEGHPVWTKVLLSSCSNLKRLQTFSVTNYT